MRLGGPFLLVTLSLAACAAVAPSMRAAADVPTHSLDNCSNAALVPFTGREATQDLGTQLLAASGAKVMRWVPMGALVTMEYRADRLTVHLDATNHVKSAICG